MTTFTEADRFWTRSAIDLSRLSPPSPSHYAVGAVVVGPSGNPMATGFTGETDPHYHAEEAALAKLAGRGLDLSGATVYTSLEPCTTRKSRPTSCTELIRASGIRRVVLALREPSLFADCHGVETLLADGIEVLEIADLGEAVRAINAHVLGMQTT
ncbi:dCMP deaminase [Actinoplanes sp. NPDC051851]|uniref:dCMP deaminase n=1 Tax=Actinoplanes sp. NPDC051851 TaxID=3154753 RepID=UPI0034410047